MGLFSFLSSTPDSIRADIDAATYDQGGDQRGIESRYMQDRGFSDFPLGDHATDVRDR